MTALCILSILFLTFLSLSGSRAVSGVLPGFQNEIVKKIFRQSADFCFHPYNARGCEPNPLWDSFLTLANDTNAPQPKTMAFLFTPSNPKQPEYLHECGGMLPNNTNFSPDHKTEIFIHGYVDGVCRSAWMREMKKELFKRGWYNVILIDWAWGNGPIYMESANNTKMVSEQIIFLLKNIMRKTGVGPQNFHLIGHSFGAHIAGFVGQSIRNLRRITALDPALSPYENKSRHEKLDPSDANLVDVIHTNGGTVAGEVLGDINPLGHADFYPNGGTKQDSCRSQILRSFLSLDFLYATISLVPKVCSHLHAIQYYKSSINPKHCELVGVQCSDYESFLSGKCQSCLEDGSNCSVMGMNHEFYRSNRTASDSGFRKFYLNTTNVYPYCENNSFELDKLLDFAVSQADSFLNRTTVDI